MKELKHLNKYFLSNLAESCVLM